VCGEVCGRIGMRLAASRKLRVYALSMDSEDGETYSKRRKIKEYDRKRRI
jgi:hypothetical protein